MANTGGARNKVRPIIIQGHERPLTMVKYNREGDLLFTAAKDYRPCMWYADNGERIGTFEGHTGTVWCVDVNCKRHPSAPLRTRCQRGVGASLLTHLHACRSLFSPACR